MKNPCDPITVLRKTPVILYTALRKTPVILYIPFYKKPKPFLKKTILFQIKPIHSVRFYVTLNGFLQK